MPVCFGLVLQWVRTGLIEGGYGGVNEGRGKGRVHHGGNGQIMKTIKLATDHVNIPAAYINLILIMKRPSVRHRPPAPKPLIRIRRSSALQNGRAREPFREALLIMPRTRWGWGGDRTSRHVMNVQNQILDHVQYSYSSLIKFVSLCLQYVTKWTMHALRMLT